MYPSPNDFTGDKGDLLNTAGFRFNAPTPYIENNYVGRVDLNPGQNHHFFGRVTYNRINAVQSPVQFPGDPGNIPLSGHQPCVGGWLGLDDRQQQSEQPHLGQQRSPTSGSRSPITRRAQTSTDGTATRPAASSSMGSTAAPTGRRSRYFPVPVVRDDFQLGPRAVTTSPPAARSNTPRRLCPLRGLQRSSCRTGRRRHRAHRQRHVQLPSGRSGPQPDQFDDL